MSRRFFRPFFSFWDPFIHDPFFPRRTHYRQARPERDVQEVKEKIPDPFETFDNFFKEYTENLNALKAEEKEFFEKHYPEKIGKKYNPYQVLGLQNNEDLEKVKEAYRTNALKYHPKNNSSPEAQKKFQEISRAYNEIVNQKQTDDYGEDISTKSLFQDFTQKVQNLSKTSKTEASKQSSKGGQVQQKDSKQQGNNKQNPLQGAELYSESSYYEYVNGKKKLHVNKTYQKGSQTIKVERVEESRPDGTVEVTETLDDGTEVKNKKFIMGKNDKQKQQQIGK